MSPIEPTTSLCEPTRRRLPIAAVAAVAVLAAAPLVATTYVMVSDETLVAQADAIALVEVTEVAPSPSGGRPSTDWTVEVERTLAGAPLGSVEVVRVPGGVGPGGLELIVWGVPHLDAGDRALLFLASRADGTWEPLHLMLGAFREVRGGGRRLAVRDLEGTTEVALAGAAPKLAPGADRLRDLDRFADWIAERAAGREPAADYFVDDPGGRLQQAVDAFTLLKFPDGMSARWQVFAGGGNVPWRTQTGGYAGVAGGGINRIQAAMTAINADSQTPIDYRHAGTTGATLGFTSFDGINATIFGDPNGEVPGTFQCPGGGVLAFGGSWAQGTHQFQGKTFKTSVGAEIIFNNGIDCTMSGNPSLFEEVWGHEALHSLGLGHSCGDANSPACAGNALLDGALMRALAHDDGRGAQLNGDDLAGLRSIYGTGGGSTGPCVPGPTTRCLSQGRFRVAIDFTAPGSPQGQAQGGNFGSDSAYFTFFDPSNVEVLVKVLNACGLNSRYWVFAAGLTNVRVDITVTDTANGTTKTYTNPQGKAFQPIQDTAAFATCP